MIPTLIDGKDGIILVVGKQLKLAYLTYGNLGIRVRKVMNWWLEFPGSLL